MKYIRTTYGRIGYLRREPDNEAADYEMLTSTGFVTYRSKDEVAKIADNIEELCDELIFDNFYHSCMTPSAMHTKENQEIIKGYLKQNIICYGAIWTDKGLIYVAKMKGVLPNSEIDWELL